jgi:hypothetical protein
VQQSTKKLILRERIDKEDIYNITTSLLNVDKNSIVSVNGERVGEKGRRSLQSEEEFVP